MKLRVIDIGGSGVKSTVFSYDYGRLTSDAISYFPNPDWENFAPWLSNKVPQDCSLIGVSCAGFVHSSTGVVKLFRVGGWVNKKLKQGIERSIDGTKVFIMNDGEAHLFAHNDLYAHPQICISLGTSLGFSVSDSSGNVCRPGDNLNYDLGEVMLPSRAGNNRVWWALGSHGLKELQQNLGEKDGAIHFGYRLGAFLGSICSIFRPWSVVLSGGIADRYWHFLEIPLKKEFAYKKPDWLSTPQFFLSSFGINAALWGMAKYVVKYHCAICPNCGNPLTESGCCLICSYTKEIKWVRMRHIPSGLCVTCTDTETLFTREVFWRSFRTLQSTRGNNVANYFPSETGKALFAVVKTNETCWKIKAVEHRNSILLNENKIATEYVQLSHGDTIKIHSGNDDEIIAEFSIEFGSE